MKMEIKDENLITQTLHSYAGRVDIKAVGNLLNPKNQTYVIAGGAIQRDTPNDFDVYVCDGKGIDIDAFADRAEAEGYRVLSFASNAVTVKVGDFPVQFCSFAKDNPTNLIHSFDFAHCQVAVEVWSDKARGEDWQLGEVFYTRDWQLARLAETTFYTGSEFPLSSLVRCGKFLKQGKFACRSTYRRAVLAILSDVVKRGFNDASDFNQQLMAISEGITETSEAMELYYALKLHKEDCK